MKLRFSILAAASALACTIGTAQADVVVLNFEGINATYPSTDYAAIGSFYNGGTSSQGTSGVNYGVEFTDNALAICLNTPDNYCSNTSRGGVAPGSELGGLFWLNGPETYMNYAAGFENGFSFNYAAPNTPGSVSVYDGLNGTGNLLATLDLGLTPSTCGSEYSAAYCPFVAAGVNFAGVAKSISFAGTANYIVFDDVTFGSAIPGVPEPSTYALFGLGLLGLAYTARRRSRG
ncbi:MAG TPA: PEP-CTERM sorting domain-containing protein [Burkholderiaceae bacterium]|nr:PEP-CTERM sorting domain-containing protein [Burkholderiaceae bacterium]HRP28897.1 PEP-CTERM sorting domain-containing protein [Burkholderiaceae bacterium]